MRRARITLSGSGAQRLADTDAKGAYRLDRLPAGELTIKVTLTLQKRP